ncbi:MAG: hypothetical protein WCA32_09170 [Chromatiaceae bacterium]
MLGLVWLAVGVDSWVADSHAEASVPAGLDAGVAAVSGCGEAVATVRSSEGGAGCGAKAAEARIGLGVTDTFASFVPPRATAGRALAGAGPAASAWRGIVDWATLV